MPPIIREWDARLDRIAVFGYTRRQAIFLCRVVDHGGYFVRRQYLRFVGQQTGHSVADFTELLQDWRHAKAFTYGPGAHLYRVTASVFHHDPRAVGKRERARPTGAGIRQRLLGLDYVLDHPGIQFLPRDQMAAVCQATAGGPASVIPQARYRGRVPEETVTRYFVGAGPLGILLDGPLIPVPVFVCVEDRTQAAAGFRTDLYRYVRLLRALPRWHVVYVTDLERAARTARRVFTEIAGSLVLPAPPETTRISADARTFEVWCAPQPYAGVEVCQPHPYRRAGRGTRVRPPVWGLFGTAFDHAEEEDES